MAPEELPNPLTVALEVGGILERLGVPYVLAGSLASSVHGEPRSTNDVDFMAALSPRHIDPLMAALRDAYYLDGTAVRDAVRSGGTFNIINLATAVKVDLFVAGTDPFESERLACRERMRLGPAEEDELWVDTAEHTVLRKLEWYRRGGETSERQWRDVLGILRAHGRRLDRERLDRWARQLAVDDLLALAWSES